MSNRAVRWIRIGAVLLALVSIALAVVDAMGYGWFAEGNDPIWDKLAIFGSASGITIAVAVLLAPFEPFDGTPLDRAMAAARWDTGNAQRSLYRRTLETLERTEVGRYSFIVRSNEDPLRLQSAIVLDSLAHGVVTIITTVDELLKENGRFGRIVKKRLALRSRLADRLGVIEDLTIVIVVGHSESALRLVLAAWEELSFDRPRSQLIAIDADVDPTAGLLTDNSLRRPGAVFRAALKAGLAVLPFTVASAMVIVLSATAFGGHPTLNSLVSTSSASVVLGPPLVIFLATCVVCAAPRGRVRFSHLWRLSHMWWPVLPAAGMGLLGYFFWGACAGVGLTASAVSLLVISGDTLLHDRPFLRRVDGLILLSILWMLLHELDAVNAIAWTPFLAIAILRSRTVTARSAVVAALATSVLLLASFFESPSRLDLVDLDDVQTAIALISIAWLAATAPQDFSHQRNASTWVRVFTLVLSVQTSGQIVRLTVNIADVDSLSYQGFYRLWGLLFLLMLLAWSHVCFTRLVKDWQVRFLFTSCVAAPALLESGLAADLETSLFRIVPYVLIGFVFWADMHPVAAPKALLSSAVGAISASLVGLVLALTIAGALLANSLTSELYNSQPFDLPKWERFAGSGIVVALIVIVLVMVCGPLAGHVGSALGQTLIPALGVVYIVMARAAIVSNELFAGSARLVVSLTVYPIALVVAIQLLRPWLREIRTADSGIGVLWFWVVITAASQEGLGNLSIAALALVGILGGPSVCLARRLTLPTRRTARLGLRLAIGVFMLGGFSEWSNGYLWLIVSLVIGAIQACVADTASEVLPVARRFADTRRLTRLAMALASLLGIFIVAFGVFVAKFSYDWASTFSSSPLRPVEVQDYVLGGLLALIPAEVLLLAVRNWANARTLLLVGGEARVIDLGGRDARQSVSKRRSRIEIAAAPAPAVNRDVRTRRPFLPG